jgi:hypothetical protein
VRITPKENRAKPVLVEVVVSKKAYTVAGMAGVF